MSYFTCLFEQPRGQNSGYRPCSVFPSWHTGAGVFRSADLLGLATGERVWSGFNFDILQFLMDFEPDAVALSTRQHIDPSELTFEGRFRGRGVFLHLCFEPPEDAEATEIVEETRRGPSSVDR